MRGETKLGVQVRVILALMVREMVTRYGRSSLGYVWAVLDPAGFVFMISLVFSQIAHNPPLGESFALFYATGYMAFHIYADVSSVVSHAVHVNRPLFSFPRISPLDAVIARFLLQAMTATLVCAIILGALLAVVGGGAHLQVGPVLTAMALSALLALGMGIINCVLFIYSPTWEKLFGIINRPLFLISGVFFLFEGLPYQIRDVLWWNPLIHLTALMRSGFYPIYEPTFVSVSYVLFVGLTLLMLGGLLLAPLKGRLVDR